MNNNGGKISNISEFIKVLDEDKGFFTNVDIINKYNIDAIVELIQYNNVKETGSPLFSKKEIRQAIKKYFQVG